MKVKLELKPDGIHLGKYLKLKLTTAQRSQLRTQIMNTASKSRPTKQAMENLEADKRVMTNKITELEGHADAGRDEILRLQRQVEHLNRQVEGKTRVANRSSIKIKSIIKWPTPRPWIQSIISLYLLYQSLHQIS